MPDKVIHRASDTPRPVPPEDAVEVLRGAWWDDGASKLYVNLHAFLTAEGLAAVREVGRTGGVDGHAVTAAVLRVALATFLADNPHLNLSGRTVTIEDSTLPRGFRAEGGVR